MKQWALNETVAVPIEEFASGSQEQARRQFRAVQRKVRIRAATTGQTGAVQTQAVGVASAAASAIRKHPTNGWSFWHYERGPNDWVPLDQLRE